VEKNVLIECVPNVSEGVDQTIIDSLKAAIVSGGATILHTDQGKSANRTVFTYCGSPQEVIQSSIRLIESAIQHIDLRTHTGTHPRIGAVDVLPFVPLHNSTLADCDECARIVAEACADKLKLPFFLYEASQKIPARANLPYYRYGGFEALPKRLASGELESDYGPQHHHPSAGATVIGARNFLIAYNINLSTKELSTAKRIASKLRERNGGLSRVRAIGWDAPERNCTQVSCNLLDYSVTNPRDVFAATKQLADFEGIEVTGAELIGLIPQAALIPEELNPDLWGSAELTEKLRELATSIGLDIKEFIIEDRVIEYLLVTKGLFYSTGS
jgi:glutamate formiminotransferase / 5-formyltetrahydrofolate cyclo-ligase